MKFRMYSSDWKKRFRLFVLAALLLCFAWSALAAEIPAPTSDFYVNDCSGVLSAETKAHIVETNVELYAKTGAQVVVVTMETLSGDDLNRFATDMFRSYGIGDSEKNNGVLLLVVTGDRDLRIEVGYGLEGAINDAKAGRLLDKYVVPYLAKNKWDEGILSGFDAIVKEVRTEYGLEDPGAKGEEGPGKEETEEEVPFFERYGGKLAVSMGLSLVVGLLTGTINRGALIVNLLWLVGVFYYFLEGHGGLLAGAAVFACGLWQLVGYAATSPGGGSSSGGSYSSGGSSYSSYSGSSSGSSYSSHSGGGGSSGGGGASRKF